MRYRAGFTLIEIMLVVAIMAILASVIVFSTTSSSEKSRDIKRQADLRAVQSALELYKLKYNRYPAACRTITNPLEWSGQTDTDYECPSGDSQYIVGLAPEFIPTLPQDPKLNGSNSGYVYATNAAGTVYKFEAKNTVEGEVVDDSHEFKSCDITSNNAGVCNKTYGNSNSKPNHCGQTSPVYRSSYAVWGGKPIETFTTGVRSQEQEEKVICDIP